MYMSWYESTKEYKSIVYTVISHHTKKLCTNQSTPQFVKKEKPSFCSPFDAEYVPTLQTSCSVSIRSILAENLLWRKVITAAVKTCRWTNHSISLVIKLFSCSVSLYLPTLENVLFYRVLSCCALLYIQHCCSCFNVFFVSRWLNWHCEL